MQGTVLQDASRQAEPLLADKGLPYRSETTVFGAVSRETTKSTSNFDEHIVRSSALQDNKLYSADQGSKSASNDIYAGSRTSHEFSKQYQQRIPTTLLLARRNMNTNKPDSSNNRQGKMNSFSCLNLFPCFYMMDDASMRPKLQPVNLEIPNVKYNPSTLNEYKESTSTANEAVPSLSEQNSPEKKLNSSVNYQNDQKEYNSDDENSEYKYDLYSSLRADIDKLIQPVSNQMVAFSDHSDVTEGHTKKAATQSDQSNNRLAEENYEPVLVAQLKVATEQENVRSLSESQVYERMISPVSKHEHDVNQPEDKIAEISFSDEAKSDFSVISNPQAEDEEPIEEGFKHPAVEDETQQQNIIEPTTQDKCNKSFELFSENDRVENAQNLNLLMQSTDGFEMLEEKLKCQNNALEN